MDDKDNLYFSFDDNTEEPEQEKEVKAEEGQNRTFLIGAIVLAGVFVLGICAVVGYLLFGSQLLGTGNATPGPSSNELTNQVILQQIDQTSTAAFETQSAPTAVPSKTPAPKPSVTPTSAIIETTPLGTQVGEVTQEGTPGTAGPSPTPGLAGAATTAAPSTGTPGTGTPNAVGPASGAGTASPTTKPTSSIIEVTALGGPSPTSNGSPTSSIIEVTAGGQGGGSNSTPTGIGGPSAITPGVTATIPSTGFGGGAGLAGAGFLAMLLVVVVVVVRKIRLNQ